MGIGYGGSGGSTRRIPVRSAERGIVKSHAVNDSLRKEHKFVVERQMASHTFHFGTLLEFGAQRRAFLIQAVENVKAEHDMSFLLVGLGIEIVGPHDLREQLFAAPVMSNIDPTLGVGRRKEAVRCKSGLVRLPSSTRAHAHTGEDAWC